MSKKTFIKIASVILALVLGMTALWACGDEGVQDKDATDNNASAAAVKVIDINLTDEEYAFGVDKDQPELLEKVNTFIRKIKADGTFDEICNKYFGDGTPTPVVSAEEDPSKEQLVVATNAAFEPFEYTKGSDYYGIDMEIAALLAEELGLELVIKHMDFDAVCLSVGEHKCDIAMAGLTVKPAREKHVTFSETYYTASQKIIVKGDDTTFDDCKTVEDVEAILNTFDSSTKIGVQNGTTGQLYVKGDVEWEFDGFKANCVGYKNGSLAVNDMINGNIQYVIIDSAPAECIAKAVNKLA